MMKNRKDNFLHKKRGTARGIGVHGECLMWCSSLSEMVVPRNGIEKKRREEKTKEENR
jgi:hypothetical protein